MRYLIDTNLLLWFSIDDKSITSEHKQIIENHNNDIYVSMASLWEIGIKYSLNKINLTTDINNFLMR